jgi:hypothetical protein
MPIVTNTYGFNRGHVETVIRHKVAREIMAVTWDARLRAGNLEDPYEIAGELDHFVSTIGVGAHGNEPEAVTLWEMSEHTAANAPWVIEGALRSDWRAVVTGEEGAGKGVLLRCAALSIAAGYHPFTHRPAEPKKALVVDLENPEASILETGLVLTESLVQRSVRDDRPFDETMCKTWHRPGGINIRSRPDRADLVREIAAQKPDLVCVGPWYKLTRRKNNESWEDAALEALAILDDLRTKYGFALMIEAHSPKGDGRHRDLHPLGSVYLSAWPELGIGLVKEEDSPHILDVIHWRGARLKQLWPNQILRDPRMIISGKWGSHVGRIDF